MPLAKQNIPLPLTRGIDKSTADQLRSPESLSEGLNCEQLKTGEVTKRNGFTTTATPSSFNASAFFDIQNSPTVIGNPDGVIQGQILPETRAQTLLESETSFAQKTSSISAGVVYAEVEEIPAPAKPLRPAINYFDANCLIDNDNLYVVRNDTTGASYDSELNLVATNLFNIPVPQKAVREYFFAYLTTNVSVYDRGQSVAAASILSPAITIGGSFDVCGLTNGQFALAWDDGSNIQLHIYDSNFTSTSSTTLANTNLKFLSLIPLPEQSGFYLFIGRTSSATQANRIEMKRYNESLTLLQTRLNNSSSTVQEAYAITGVEIPGRDRATIYIEYDPTTPGSGNVEDRLVFQFTEITTSTSSTAISITTGIVQCGLESEAFVLGDSNEGYVLLCHESTDSTQLQNCLFLANGSDIVTRLQYGLSDGLISNDPIAYPNRFLRNVPKLSDGSALTVILNKTSSDPTDPLAAGSYEYSIKALRISEETAYQGSKTATLGNVTLFSHGALYSILYDEIVPAFFELYPNPPSVTKGSGGSLDSSGTYSYVVVYEYSDEKGNFIESAPSSPTTVDMLGQNQNTLTLDLAGFLLGKTAQATIYRTLSGGTTYYAIDRQDITSTKITYVDTEADSTVRDNKILYTTGGVAENITPSNTYFIAAAKNRFWTFEAGNKKDLWFSKKPREGIAPQFSDLQIQKIPSQGGKLVGVAQIDDKLIVFKRSRVFALFGDGPTDNLQGSFSEPTVIIQGMGCISARSILETPQGVFFQSNEGIYLIDRSLQNIFIGRPLYEEQGSVLTSAYDANLNRAFFLTSSQIWVYHITTQSWYEWTNPSGIDLIVIGGEVFLLKATGEVLKIGSGWQDDGVNYAQTIKLGQFQFSGIQGYQRVYRVLATGKDNGDAGSDSVNVKTFVNGNTTATDNLTSTHSDLITNNRMELEIRPSIQKCESIEVEISTTSATSGVTLAVVSAEVGGYAGSGRRSSAVRST